MSESQQTKLVPKAVWACFLNNIYIYISGTRRNSLLQANLWNWQLLHSYTGEAGCIIQGAVFGLQVSVSDLMTG
jgi:hypothetical protein